MLILFHSYYSSSRKKSHLQSHNDAKGANAGVKFAGRHSFVFGVTINPYTTHAHLSFWARTTTHDTQRITSLEITLAAGLSSGRQDFFPSVCHSKNVDWRISFLILFHHQNWCDETKYKQELFCAEKKLKIFRRSTRSNSFHQKEDRNVLHFKAHFRQPAIKVMQFPGRWIALLILFLNEK